MKSALIRCLWLFVCLVTYIGTTAQYAFRPYVINEDRTDSVQFEYKVSDFTTLVTFRIENEVYDMYDDGTHGDRIAGDRIFTINLDPQRFISTMQADDAFRPEVGTVLFGNQSGYMGVFAQVRTSVMPDVPIASVTEDLQLSPRVINIRSSSQLSYQHIFRELKNHGFSREADFLNIVYLPSKSSAPTYTSLRNDVTGLGLPEYDLINDPVISTKFKGVITMPISTQFDGASRNTVRFLASQWVPHLGYPFTVCEHWAVSDLARSIIGYDRDGYGQCMSQDLQYRIIPISGTSQYGFVYDPQDIKYFNDLDLYLMGLGPAQNVGPFVVFDDQMAVLSALRTNPASYRGAASEYTMDDVIALVGERSPAFGEAPTSFRVYTVVLSPELLTRDEMAYYDYMASRGEGDKIVYTRSGYVKELGSPFAAATNGAGSMIWQVHALMFPERTLSADICHGEIFTYDGVEYTDPGVYYQIAENETGKDTIVTLELNWLPKNEVDIEANICFGDLYEFNGTLIDEEGIYYDTVSSAIGCDSFVKLDLSVMPEDGSEMYVEMCPGDEFEFGDSILRESGVFSNTFQNVLGCDSTVFLTLDVDVSIDGGRISASGDQEYFTICLGDGRSDVFNFTTSAELSDYAFVCTDQYNNVVRILSGPSTDFENSGPDAELVWGISYSGELLIKPGDNLFDTEITDKCYSISNNFLEVHKQTDGLYCAMLEEKPYSRAFDFSVAPNPTSDQVDITLRSFTDTTLDGTLEIIGINGVTIFSNRVGIYSGLNTWVIEVDNYVPGVYVVRVPELNALTKFVKL